MKAYKLHGINNLKYEDTDIPAISKGWALIKVKATGICSSDIPRIFSKGTYHFPTIPGHEFSGIVESVASPEDRHWVGKRVGVFPLIPCFKCKSCQNHHYEMCEHYDYIGSRRDGAFAEYVSAPVWNLIELPSSMSFEAGAMLEPISVALHAVKRAAIGPNETVAVIGTGIIGIAAAQWARTTQAANVYVIGRSNDKCKYLPDVDGITYTTDITSLLSKADVVIEAVGSLEAINEAIQLVQANGRIVLVGNPAGDISLPQDVYWKILRKQLSLIGSWNSYYEHDAASDWSEACNALGNGDINVDTVISHHFTQNALDKGLQLMKEHIESYCKVMVNWNE